MLWYYRIEEEDVQAKELTGELVNR